MLRIALLASGRGSNVQAILDAIAAGALAAQVQCIVSNVADAPVLALGASYDIPSHAVPHAGLTRTAHEDQLLAVLSQYNIDYVVLAGYMRLLTPKFLHAFVGNDHYRVINIHPAMLPAFPGAHAYENAFASGVKYSGITVHCVDEQVDHGPLLLQEPFPRLDTDTLETFKARGLALEHQLYPKALQLLAQNQFVFHKDATTGHVTTEVKAHAVC